MANWSLSDAVEALYPDAAGGSVVVAGEDSSQRPAVYSASHPSPQAATHRTVWAASMIVAPSWLIPSAFTVTAENASSPDTTASSLVSTTVNWPGAALLSTLTWVQVGAGHKISITADGADTHVLVDVVGYLAGGGSGRFCPLPTARVADVRGARARSRTRVSIRGVGGVPASGVSAVVLKLSSSAPSRVASLTAYTVGASRPSLASLFSKPGRVTENLVVVAPGRYGAAYVYNSSGTTDLTVDVVGYFT